MTPPTIAIGNVPAIPPQKPANPTEDPNHPPAVAPPIVATPSLVDAAFKVFLRKPPLNNKLKKKYLL